MSFQGIDIYVSALLNTHIYNYNVVIILYIIVCSFSHLMQHSYITFILDLF